MVILECIVSYTMSQRHKMKVVLLGEGRVGKTSIVLRFVRNEYDDHQESTLQASFLSKNITIGSQSVKLSIWDTAGQERFHALGPLYYRDANGALLVYDITDMQSFERVGRWVKELRKIVGPDIAIVIAGNKSDLEKQRNVDHEEAQKYAESVGAQHFLTSAKQNKNLDKVFLELTKRMLKQQGAGAGGRKARKTLIIQDEDQEERKSGGDCAC